MSFYDMAITIKEDRACNTIKEDHVGTPLVAVLLLALARCGLVAANYYKACINKSKVVFIISESYPYLQYTLNKKFK